MVLSLKIIQSSTHSFVSGLDPAGPYFEDKDWSIGINPSVADFVDIWHTNGDTNLVIPFGTLKVCSSSNTNYHAYIPFLIQRWYFHSALNANILKLSFPRCAHF